MTTPDLWLLGVDFSTAPLAVREPLSYTPEAVSALLHASKPLLGLHEALVVSTCNRTEFYLVTDPGDSAVKAWLTLLRTDRPNAPIGQEGCVLFRARGAEAARHLFRVCCGLESSLLGDVHIGGQLKQALSLAGGAGTLGPFLTRTFQHAFGALKDARSRTAIGRGHASLGSAVARVVEDLGVKRPNVLVIGGGTAARDIGRQLAKWQVGALTFINRTPERSAELARHLTARSAPWTALDDELLAADVVVAATSAAEPIVRQEQLVRCLASRPTRPLLIVDVGVPRNVEATEGARYITVDDIAVRQDEALGHRQRAVPAVEALIERRLTDWTTWVWTRPGEDLLKRIFIEEREQRETLIQQLMADEYRGSSDQLDHLLSRAWSGVLHRHARGMRQWLHTMPSMMATAHHTAIQSITSDGDI